MVRSVKMTHFMRKRIIVNGTTLLHYTIRFIEPCNINHPCLSANIKVINYQDSKISIILLPLIKDFIKHSIARVVKMIKVVIRATGFRIGILIGYSQLYLEVNVAVVIAIICNVNAVLNET